MFAVCVECKNHIHDIQNKAAPEVWYNHFCGAKELPKTRDPITGKETHQGKNDFDMTFATDQKYDYCSYVNKAGECEFYVPKEPR